MPSGSMENILGICAQAHYALASWFKPSNGVGCVHLKTPREKDCKTAKFSVCKLQLLCLNDTGNNAPCGDIDELQWGTLMDGD